MALSIRKRILTRVGNVKSVPVSALQAMRLLQDPNSNMGEIVQTIAYDPGLTSNILRMANSSYFGFSGTIASLKEGIVKLGSKSIFNLVASSIANNTLKTAVNGYEMGSEELWEHSIAVAVASENLAALVAPEESNTAFTAGLLHDLGKTVLGNFIDKNIKKQIYDKVENKIAIVDAEREILNIDHAELGGKLLEEWRLPINLVKAVEFHHQPDLCREDEYSLYPNLVHIADLICIANNIGTTKKPLNVKLSSKSYKKLNITREIIDEVIERTQDSFQNVKDVFSKR